MSQLPMTTILNPEDIMSLSLWGCVITNWEEIKNTITAVTSMVSFKYSVTIHALGRVKRKKGADYLYAMFVDVDVVCCCKKTLITAHQQQPWFRNSFINLKWQMRRKQTNKMSSIRICSGILHICIRVVYYVQSPYCSVLGLIVWLSFNACQPPRPSFPVIL